MSTAIMTLSELQAFQQVFRKHFFLGNTNNPVEERLRGFPFNELRRFRDDYDAEHPTAKSEGIFITYGLIDGLFSPIIELYRRNGVAMECIAGSIHAEGWTSMQEAARAEAERAYTSNVWVIPSTSQSIRAIRIANSESEGDLKGMSYTWSKLDQLYDDNKGPGLIDPVLMITSISDAVWGSEQKHLTALYIVDIGMTGNPIVLVDNKPSSSFAMRSVDLGSPCPSNCPRR